jgi:hypothetical protein
MFDLPYAAEQTFCFWRRFSPSLMLSIMKIHAERSQTRTPLSFTTCSRIQTEHGISFSD